MLDTNDLKAIARLIDGSIEKKVPSIVTNAIGGFFESVIAPYFDQITKRLERLENNNDTFFRKAEVNEVQHGEILKKLEEIDESVKDHDKRVKRLKKTLATS